VWEEQGQPRRALRWTRTSRGRERNGPAAPGTLVRSRLRANEPRVTQAPPDVASAGPEPSPAPSVGPNLRVRAEIALSHGVGWLADRYVPRPLRSPLYRTYAALTGADLTEMRGALGDHPCLGAFFVRRLRDGLRPIDPDPRALPSPVDGLVQASSPVTAGHVVEAKGRTYPLRDLLAGVGEDLELEGGHAITLYLGPKDYHRIHSPLDAKLVEARHVPGRRLSVQPRVLAKRQVFALNERVVLRLESERHTVLMVLQRPHRGAATLRARRGARALRNGLDGRARHAPRRDRACERGAGRGSGPPGRAHRGVARVNQASGEGATALDPRRARIVRLFGALVAHDSATLTALREAAPPGEPDAGWREAALMAHLFCGFPRTIAGLEVLQRAGGLGAPGPDELPSAEALGDGHGATLFDRIYGAGSGAVRDALAALHPTLERWIAEHAYDRVLARPALDAATRELCAVAALTITGHDRQLASHARGAVRCGATPAEVHAALELAAPWTRSDDLERARAVVARFAT
jgi:AhpD family alkylhydroperoxidase